MQPRTTHLEPDGIGGKVGYRGTRGAQIIDGRHPKSQFEVKAQAGSRGCQRKTMPWLVRARFSDFQTRETTCGPENVERGRGVDCVVGLKADNIIK